MPNRKTHEKMSMLFLGKPYTEVHEALDGPVKYLGRGHRRLFHDPRSAMLIAWSISDDKKATLAALLHIATDKAFTKSKNRAMRK